MREDTWPREPWAEARKMSRRDMYACQLAVEALRSDLSWDTIVAILGCTDRDGPVSRLALHWSIWGRGAWDDEPWSVKHRTGRWRLYRARTCLYLRALLRSDGDAPCVACARDGSGVVFHGRAARPYVALWSLAPSASGSGT